MGCCNEPVSVLTPAALDPTQHVNFTKGMVLGVDDFAQEFACLSGRDHALVRDALGYGTVSGLRVFAESDGAEGPRLHVSAGSALVPSGRHVCVPADQCAVINRWLAKPENAAIVNRLLNPVSPPLSPPLVLSPPAVATGAISLYLTLCWADCLTRPVPIPGEPCRSEDELMADSRIADDFRLELRAAPPVQVEEDALRDFVRWLRTNVQVADASPPPAGDDAAWLDALRPAVQPWLDAAAMSPPLSPPASVATLGDYLSDLSPPNLTVARDRLCEFLRVAFRFWVTELRPLWTAYRCHRVMHPDADCVLLARVEFEVAWVGGSPTGAWQIAGSPATVSIDETVRPFLAHQRLLQEWLLCGCDCGGLGTAAGMGGSASLPPVLAPGMPGAAAGAPRVALATTSADLTLDDGHYCVICRDATSLTLTLPASLPINAGRVHIIKNVDVSILTIVTDAVAGNLIDDKASLTVKKRKAVTLIADGAGQWQIVGMLA